MSNFDWQTEEEGEITPPLPVIAADSSRHAILILPIILLFIIAAVIVYWQLGRNASLRKQAVNQDVLAAYRLWRQAAQRSDADMLNTLLVGADPDWTMTQRQLLETGLTLDRSALGLTLKQDLHALSREPDVELSPDWRQANLSFDQEYVLAGEGTTQGSIHLQQAVSFVRNGSQWTLGQPGEDYWGEWLTYKGELVTLTYPERDQEYVQRFARDLDLALATACAERTADHLCPEDAHIDVRLERDPSVMFKLVDRDTPAFSGRTFVLPTPTLIGLPQDNLSYRVAFGGYADRIVNTFSAWLANPSPLPSQTLKIICYAPHDRLPRLFNYDLDSDTWKMVEHDRSFRYLSSDDHDEASILREFVPGSESRLRAVLQRKNREVLLIDQALPQEAAYRVGWSTGSKPSRILFQSVGSAPGSAAYGWFDLDDCLVSGCNLINVGGLPHWSPDGQWTVLEGSDELFLGDSQGQINRSLGNGFSPFWLDSSRFGFARYVKSEAGLTVDVLITDPKGGDMQRVFGSEQLAETLEEGGENPIFIDYITAIPVEPWRLLFYGRQYAGADSNFFIFSGLLDLSTAANSDPPEVSDVRLLLKQSNPPAGYPSFQTPTGYAPFVVSPDGRWLSISTLADQQRSIWRIDVVDIESATVTTYRTRHPAFTFRHPYYDWSADSKWLAIMDDGFLRLVAPAYGYERIVSHGMNACSYPAWVNQW